MTSLLLITLLCPDTVYFNVPFTVHIIYPEPAPPGVTYQPLPTAWQTGVPLAGIVGEGKFKAGADSLQGSVNGPGDYFADGAHAGLGIGTFDAVKGTIKMPYAASCGFVVKAPFGDALKPKAVNKPKARRGWLFRHIRLDGRTGK